MYDRKFLPANCGRRTFLKISVVFLGTLAGGSLTACGNYLRAPKGLKFLDDKTYTIIKAFSERIIPQGGPFPEGAGDIDVVEFFDSIVSAEPPEIQKDMRRGIILLEHGTLPFKLRFRRFTKLPPEEQDDYLRGWENSRITLLRGVFKGFVDSTYKCNFSSRKER